MGEIGLRCALGLAQRGDFQHIGLGLLHRGAAQGGGASAAHRIWGGGLWQGGDGVGFDAQRHLCLVAPDALGIDAAHLQPVLAVGHGHKAGVRAVELGIAQHLGAILVGQDVHAVGLGAGDGRQGQVQPLRIVAVLGQVGAGRGGQQRGGAAHLTIGLDGHAVTGIQRRAGGAGLGRLRQLGCPGLQCDLATLDGGGAALGAGLHVKARAAHAGGGHGGQHLQRARGIALAGDVHLHAALLQFDHRLQAARAATAAQLAQGHIGAGLHAHRGTIGQAHADKSVGLQLQAVALLQLLAAFHALRGTATAREGGAPLEVIDTGTGAAQQAQGDVQHLPGWQAQRVDTSVVRLQLLPQAGIAQIALGQLLQRVTGAYAVLQHRQGAGIGAGLLRQCAHAEGAAQQRWSQVAHQRGPGKRGRKSGQGVQTRNHGQAVVCWRAPGQEGHHKEVDGISSR